MEEGEGMLQTLRLVEVERSSYKVLREGRGLHADLPEETPGF